MSVIDFSATINLISFLTMFVFSWHAFFKRQLFFRGVWGLGYSLLFSLVPALSNIYVGANMYHPEAIDGVITSTNVYLFYCIMNFVFSMIFTVFLLTKKKGIRIRYNLDAQHYLLLKNIFGLIFIFAVMLYVIATGFKAPSLLQLIQLIINSGRMAHFNNSGYNSLLMNLSFYLMSSIAVFTFLDIRIRRKNSMLSVLVYSLLILITVISGARQFIMLAMSAAFLGYYLSPKYSGSKLSLFGALTIAVLVSWQMIRAAIFKGSFDHLSIDNMILTILSGDLSYFYYSSLESIRQYLLNDVMFFANIYRNLIFMFLPSEWTFGLKQRDLSYLFAFAYESSSDMRSGNYPPGLLGLFVLNFGMFGILFIGLPLLLFIRILEGLNQNGMAYMVIGSSFVFVTLQLFRGTLLGIYQMVALLIMVFCVTQIIKILKGQYETNSTKHG